MDRHFSLLVAVNALVLIAAASIAAVSFVSVDNLQSMAVQIPELGLLAIGVALAMISGNGGSDLSGVAVANLSGIVAALSAPQWISPDGYPLTSAFVFTGVCLCVGLVCGVVNGVLVSRAGLTPITATLGASLVFTGVSVILTDRSGARLGYIEPLDNFDHMPALGAPICFALFIAIAAAIGGTLRVTPFGVRLYLLGSDAKAARFAGFNQRRRLAATYAISSLLASVAGYVIAARISSVKWDYGTSYGLIAILIVVMAGVNAAGGHGKSACVVLSAAALASPAASAPSSARCSLPCWSRWSTMSSCWPASQALGGRSSAAASLFWPARCSPRANRREARREAKVGPASGGPIGALRRKRATLQLKRGAKRGRTRSIALGSRRPPQRRSEGREASE